MVNIIDVTNDREIAAIYLFMKAFFGGGKH